jgi:large subunit ribosomal protein L24
VIARIKKGDIVVAIRGEDRGKTGKVLELVSDGERALVEGLHLAKKAVRKSQERPQGGFADREAPIHVSNLMLYCPHDKRGVRSDRVMDGDRKVRKCKRCGHVFGG